jgi:hypothetical protein
MRVRKADKPIIQYGVEEALAAGCDQIIIVTGRENLIMSIEDETPVLKYIERLTFEGRSIDSSYSATLCGWKISDFEFASSTTI